MKSLLLTAALAALAGPALAAPPPTWVVDKAHSAVRFSSSFNGAAFTGGFSRWNADIRFDPTNLAASQVTAVVDVASAATGDADRDQALPTDDFLAAAKFPRATFTAHAFKTLGVGRYLAVGQLSLRGVSKPLNLPFTLKIAGAKAVMTASVPLDRLAFGVGQNEWRKTDAIPGPVTVAIAINADRR
jgi:polyisoprenoid-binding protein YceI